ILPSKQPGAVNRGRWRVCLRRGPRGGNESDVLAIDRNKTTLTQSFQHSLTRAQSRLGLFAVRPGIEHRRQQQNMPGKLPSALVKEIPQRTDVVRFYVTCFS